MNNQRRCSFLMGFFKARLVSWVQVLRMELGKSFEHVNNSLGRNVFKVWTVVCLLMMMVFIGSCANTSGGNNNGPDLMSRTDEARSDMQSANSRDQKRDHDVVRLLSKDPSQLDQLSMERAKSALKGLSLERKEAGNTNLQFKSDLCVLDLFYASSSRVVVDAVVTNKHAMPAHIEVRSLHDGEWVEQNACVKSLL